MMNEDRMNRKSKCRIDIVIQFTLTFNGTSSSIAFKLTAIASIPRDEIYASSRVFSFHTITRNYKLLLLCMGTIWICYRFKSIYDTRREKLYISDTIEDRQT